MGAEIINITVTKTSADIQDTDFFEGQTAAGGPGSTFKIAKSELVTNAVDSVNGQTGVVVLDAGDIAFTPAGSLSSTDVQAAIVELDTETANGKAAATTTGVAISFATPQIYGSTGTPETGNITIVTTGLVQGMTQLLIHNNGTEPTYGSEIQIISGEYATGVDNYIMLLAVSTTLILVTISQEL